MRILETAVMTQAMRMLPRPGAFLAQFFPTPEQFRFKGSTSAVWKIFKNTRDMALNTMFGAEANVVAPPPIDEKSIRLARRREKIYLPGVTKNLSRSPFNADQPLGEQGVIENLQTLRDRVDYRDEFNRASLLTTGQVVLDYDGGYNVTVDYQVPAGNKPTSTVDWSDPTLDIRADIDAAKALTRAAAGVTPRYALVSAQTMGYLIANDFLTKLLAATPQGVRLAEDGVVGRFHGINWIEYDEGSNVSGTFTQYVPDDYVSFFPNPSDVGMVTAQCPSEDVEADPNDPGPFSKSWDQPDPSGTWAMLEDNSLPLIQVPGGIVIMDITGP